MSPKKTFWMIFLGAFCLYYATSAPTTTFNDPAELALGAATLSMVHATGYPLLMILGKLLIALGLDPARAMILIAVASGAGVVAGIFLLVFGLTRSQGAGILAGSILGLSPTFWSLATYGEVYALALLFVVAVWNLLIHWKRTREERWLRLAFLVAALGVGHHMAMGTFCPVFVLYVLWNDIKIIRSPRRWIPLAALFALGLSIYLYIPLRCFGPVFVIDWPPVENLKDFIFYVSGAHFRQQMFSSESAVVVQNFLMTIKRSLFQLQFVGTAGLLFGICPLFKKYRRETLLIFGTAAVNTLHSINYDIRDISVFFLPTYAALVVVAGAGLKALAERLRFDRAAGWSVLLAASILLSLFVVNHYGFAVNRRGNTFAEDYARSALADKGEGDLILSYWHYSPLLQYYQTLHGWGRRAQITNDLPPYEDWPFVVEEHPEGRVWSTIPAEILSDSFYLLPDGVLYRVSSYPPLNVFPEPPPPSPLFSAQGVSLESARLVNEDDLNAGEIAEFELEWRIENAEADTIAFQAVITDAGGRRVVTAPCQPYGFHRLPRGFEIAVATREPLNLLIPARTPAGPYRLSLIPLDDREERNAVEILEFRVSKNEEASP